jgi:UDP-N-acetylmuramate--alanine ligase
VAFEAVAPSGEAVAVRLPLVGRHNMANALAALAVAHGERVPLADAAAALADFRGTRRRFQPLGCVRSVAVVDDYAHHPTAVRATLEAARTVHRGPLWVAFQPHTRNRTSRLLDEFAAALARADGVVVTAIYEPVGRERESIGISGADLAARVSGPPTVYVPTLEDAAAYLAAHLPADSLLLTMGAGDVDRLGSLVLEALEATQ